MKQFKFSQYSYYPDITKMTNNGNDNYDYIFLGMGLTITDDTTKKSNSYMGVVYFLVDHFENDISSSGHETNISFDIPTREDYSDSFYYFDTFKNLGKKSKFSVENKTYQLSIKEDSIHSKLLQDNINISQAIDLFIQNNLSSELIKISQFIHNHKLGLENNEFQEILEHFTTEFKNNFLEDNLKTQLPSFAEAHASFLNEHLEKISNHNVAPKKLKI